MPLNRRAFLAGTAAAPLIGAFPKFAVSEMAIGSGTLTTVSDGNLVLPGSFIFGPMPLGVGGLTL